MRSTSLWTPEIARAMAQVDGVGIDEVKWQQILKAREYYEENAVVPPILKFSKYLGEDQKGMFKMWMTSPMKPITKYGGLPKPALRLNANNALKNVCQTLNVVSIPIGTREYQAGEKRSFYRSRH